MEIDMSKIHEHSPQDLWENFQSVVVPASASEGQREAMECAFFAGMFVGYQFVTGAMRLPAVEAVDRVLTFGQATREHLEAGRK